jgi:Zn-dependent membrane protease YugP
MTMVLLVLFLAAPMAVVVLVGALQRSFQARLEARAPDIGKSPGMWAKQVAAGHGAVVVAHGGPWGDATMPDGSVVSLSRSTFEGRSAVAWAIAAHELGHLVDLAERPGAWSAAARLGSVQLQRAVLGTAFAAVWLGAPWLLDVAFALLAVSVLAGLWVLREEVAASLHARVLLKGRLSAPHRRIADAALASAAVVYGSMVAGQFALAVCWQGLDQLVLGGGSALDPVAGMWLLVLGAPFLSLRVAHVALRVWRPEPVRSDLSLLVRLRRDTGWEWCAGMLIAGVVVLGTGGPVSPALALATALAATTAVGPVGGSAAALMMAGAMTIRRLAGRRPRWTPGSADVAPPGLAAVYGDPPLSLRLAWLASLGWLPFTVLLVAQALGR